MTDKEKDVLILAIESSCDETAASVVKNGREVLSNVIYSQIDLHTLYGGVVPEIASRKHIEKINQVVEKALTDAEVTLDDIVREFGERVAAYIDAESEDKRPGIPASDTWEIRKQETIQHLQTAEHPVKVIVLADKAANAESLLKEWRHAGDGMWQKFNQHDKDKHAWYYYSCAEALKEFSDSEVMKNYLEHLKELFG